MRFNRWRSVQKAGAAALLTTLLLAACLGTTPDAGSTKKRPYVRIGGFAAGAGSIAIVIDRLGVFARQGIDADFIIFPDSVVATTALIGAQIDFLVASNDRPVIEAEANGPPFKVVMGLAQRPPWTWLVHADSPLTAGAPISGLKGLTIGDGGPNTTQRFLERYLLMQAGLNPDQDVSFKMVPQNPVDATLTFERGEVDLLSAIEPTTSTILGRKTGKTFIDMRKPDSPGVIASKESLMARVDYISKNQETVKRVVVATCLGVKQAKADPQKVAELLVDYYQTQGLSFDKGQVADGIVADSGRWGGQIDADLWTKWETLLEAQGLVKHHYTFQDVVATELAPFWEC